MSKSAKIDVTETEQQLIDTAVSAISQSNWTVGECAAKWTQKYAKGRTDAEFGALIGLSGDQIFQRRRVWETYHDVVNHYPTLRWSHFYVALNWDDAPECFQWADENQATVAEMKAWRRALRGEDLTEPAHTDGWGGDPTISYVPTEPTEVRDPGDMLPSSRATGSRGESSEPAARVAGVARESGQGDGGEHAPFRSGAGTPPPKEGAGDVAVKARPEQQTSAEQLMKRMTSALNRMSSALTPEMIKDFKKLPKPAREKFLAAVAELSSKSASLM
jgi:hypothetical protein